MRLLRGCAVALLAGCLPTEINRHNCTENPGICGADKRCDPVTSACVSVTPDLAAKPVDLAAADLHIVKPDPPAVRVLGGVVNMGRGEYAELMVTLAAFNLDRYKVSVAQYRLCVQAGVCKVPGVDDANCNWNRPDREDHPINCVSQTDAQDYCGWIGRRLPTSYEWEYAARGNGAATYAWGLDSPYSQGCWDQANGTCPLVRGEIRATLNGAYDSNGVYELQGNVWEWTSTSYCDDKWTPMEVGCDPSRFLCHGVLAWSSRRRVVIRIPGKPNYPAARVEGLRGDVRKNYIGIRCAK